MDSVTTGLSILDGRTTRVVTSNSGNVFLEDLSGSGPQGPTGPSGPAGPAGTVDTSQIYTKTQMDIMRALRTISYRQRVELVLKCGILPITWSDVF